MQANNLQPAFLLLVGMDVDPAIRDEFDVAYDEHLRELLTIDGILWASRGWQTAGQVIIGGSQVKLPSGDWPSHIAVYALRDPDVLTSAAWIAAVEQGAWSASMRPLTRDRRHSLIKLNNPINASTDQRH